jgi:HTH-type transcriptional regulator, sugar sensing transcriptional regulator
MSQDKAFKTLEGLGLTEQDAKVYVFLAKRGPQKAGDAAKHLKMPKQTVYSVINRLKREGVLTSTVERPARFAAVPLEKILDLFVKTRLEDVRRVEQNKTAILSDWKSIVFPDSDEISPKFTVIQGRSTVYAKIQQMMNQTKQFLSITTSVSNLLRADHFGLLDTAFRHPMRGRIQFRFLTKLSEENIGAAKLILNRVPKQRFNLEIRVPDIASNVLDRLVIRDREEAVFFISSESDSEETEDDLCLWTNCRSIVRSLTAVFEDSWRDASRIEAKMAEIETGIESSKTSVIKDVETARRKYGEALKSAVKSVFLLTSSAGLKDCWESENLVQEWVKRGVSVRIMAPVTAETLGAARQLMKICEVKHVPLGYVETTIVDGQHLFQFMSSGSVSAKSNLSFENMFYTNNFDRVKKTENMLFHIWDSAQPPSLTALKSLIEESSTTSPIIRRIGEYRKIVGFEWISEPQRGKLTEKEIIERIKSAKRIPVKDARDEILRVYGIMGCAIVYPPGNLGLPNFIIQAFHGHRPSAFGRENFLAIFLQMKIAEQLSYLPVAFVTDNPRGYEFRKSMHTDRPTTEVVHLVKKGELEVQLRGKNLFAGWTVPIPLLPPKHVLPPACVLFKGYGDVKTYYSEVKGIFNRREIHEYNGFDAFVTFMNPSSRYSGPGSDGMLYREMIVTSYPPSP